MYRTEAIHEEKGIDMRKLTNIHGGKRRRRWLVGLASTALAIGAVGIASPAQAAGPVMYEIFYGQNCGGGATASVAYAGDTSGTLTWTTQVFNLTRWGTPGAGQQIKNNAASIFVHDGTVGIWNGSGALATYTGGADGTCYNFQTWMRNQNTRWFAYTVH